MKALRLSTRKDLLEKLVMFSKLKGNKVQVVFDGAEEQFFPDGSSYKGVKIFYAAKGADADTRIKEMVEHSEDRKGLIVVTNDNALSNYCRLCGVKTIRTAKFLTLFMSRKQELEKPSVKSHEIKDWLRYFGVDKDESN